MELLYALESIRNPVLDAVMSAATQLGGETLYLALAIIVFWCVSKGLGYYTLTVGFAGTVLNQFLKITCRIPRPWVQDPEFTIVESARAEATGYSFPSGHTQNAFASFGCIGMWSRRTLWRVVCALIIALLAYADEARRLAHALVDLGLGELHVLRAEGDVLIHRLLEELVLRVLEDEADLEAHVARGLLAREDVLPLAVHRAARGREQAVQVLHEGALARAGVAYDGDELAGAELHINAVHGRLLERSAHAVGVREVFYFYNSVHWRNPFPYPSAAIMASAHSSTVSASSGRSQPSPSSSYMNSVVAGTSRPSLRSSST